MFFFLFHNSVLCLKMVELQISTLQVRLHGFHSHWYERQGGQRGEEINYELHERNKSFSPELDN